MCGEIIIINLYVLGFLGVWHDDVFDVNIGRLSLSGYKFFYLIIYLYNTHSGNKRRFLNFTEYLFIGSKSLFNKYLRTDVITSLNADIFSNVSQAQALLDDISKKNVL